MDNAWYTKDGSDSDVVLSTRVRLARNLVNFPFPHRMSTDDAQHIQSLLLDVFTKRPDAEQFQSITVSQLDPLGKRILSERGVLAVSDAAQPYAAVVMRTDGVLSCAINTDDHVHIASFISGFNVQEAFSLCHDIDNSMQDNIQFAASVDFGFLTAHLRDIGSGLKLSVIVHLAAICYSGRLERLLRDLLAQRFSIVGYYGAGADHGTSLGNYYQIYNGYAASGSEEEQLCLLENAVRKIVQLEHMAIVELKESRSTFIADQVFRAIAIAKYSRFISVKEGIDILSKIKLGIKLGLIKGVTHSQLTALLYRIQTAHLQYVLKSESFKIENDLI